MPPRLAPTKADHIAEERRRANDLVDVQANLTAMRREDQMMGEVRAIQAQIRVYEDRLSRPRQEGPGTRQALLDEIERLEGKIISVRRQFAGYGPRSPRQSQAIDMGNGVEKIEETGELTADEVESAYPWNLRELIGQLGISRSTWARKVRQGVLPPPDLYHDDPHHRGKPEARFGSDYIRQAQRALARRQK